MRWRSTTRCVGGGASARWPASLGRRRRSTTTWPRLGEDARGHAGPSTAKTYAGVYDLHISPHLGQLKLSELTPEVIARWQAERIAAGAGRVSIHKTIDAARRDPAASGRVGRIARNPVRLVRKVKRPEKGGRPLAPATVEALRAEAGRVSRR